MQLGMIGLGRMGANMVRRLMRGGHQCVVWDQNHANVEKLAGEGATDAANLDDFLKALQPPRKPTPSSTYIVEPLRPLYVAGP